jgi:SpoVK/Ycf46/Vps4 family AAA+-type ATPase
MQTTRLQCSLGWDDLAVTEEVRDQLKQLLKWVKLQPKKQPSRGMKDLPGGGYLALFEGPAGSGKKTAAAIIGHMAAREVYRIDSSSLATKSIRETEKNLVGVLRKAQDENWILFFDEADALFGKRTEVKDAHDRYANLETNHLLQRMETHQGLTILSSNSRSNLDEVVQRHLHSLIRFRLKKR